MRARYSRRGEHVVTYDPQQESKDFVRLMMVEKLQTALNSDDKATVLDISKITRGNCFNVEFNFFLPIPESDSQTIKNLKLWGIERANGKPDLDNLLKFYLDCANGVLWPDDRMITYVSGCKKYSDKPRVEVEVSSNEDIRLSEKEIRVLKALPPNELVKLFHQMKQLVEHEQLIVDDFISDEDFEKMFRDFLYDFEIFISEFMPMFLKISKVIAKEVKA